MNDCFVGLCPLSGPIWSLASESSPPKRTWEAEVGSYVGRRHSRSADPTSNSPARGNRVLLHPVRVTGRSCRHLRQQYSTPLYRDGCIAAHEGPRRLASKTGDYLGRPLEPREITPRLDRMPVEQLPPSTLPTASALGVDNTPYMVHI